MCFFFQAEDGIRDGTVTGVQTCALPILPHRAREREAGARLAGELDAARRIQIGILPKPESAFPAERRFEISASMEPAREVGGDLYDFFMLDPDRLFFLVGDVSGKGLPASIFMAVRSEEHTSELQSQFHLVCRLL